MVQFLGILFCRLILRRSILMNPGTIKKLYAFLTGVMLWRLNFLPYRTMVLGDLFPLFLALI
jgi:hypothetical protein